MLFRSDVYPRKREALTIPYDVTWINNFLGTDLSEAEMVGYFESVEFVVDQEAKTVTIPTFRSDVTMMADLAEEVARLYGYDKITPTLERAEPTRGTKTFEQRTCDKVREVMGAHGVYGALTYTFESPKVFDKLCIKADSPLRDAMKITNPLGEEFSIMRTTSLNGILTSLSTNFNRRVEDAALYEIGKIYIKQPVVGEVVTDIKRQGENLLPAEIKKLTVGAYGKETDFFSMKGMVETLMSELHISNVEFARNSELEYMHPGRCATVLINGKAAGFFGEIHPQVAKNYSLDTKVYMAELDLAAMLDAIHAAISFKPLPRSEERRVGKEC